MSFRHLLNSILSLAGDEAAAAKARSEMVRRELDSAEYYVLKGDVLTEEKKYEEALHSYTKAIALDSHNPSYYTARCGTYLKLGRYVAAEADCLHFSRVTLDRFRALKMALIHIGMRGAAAGSELDALVDQQEACEARMLAEDDRDVRAAWAELGGFTLVRVEHARRRRAVGDYSGAISDWNMVTALTTDADDARLELGELYGLTRRPERAKVKYDYIREHGSPKARHAVEERLKVRAQ